MIAYEFGLCCNNLALQALVATSWIIGAVLLIPALLIAGLSKG